MARLIGRVAIRQIGPWRASAQHPEYPIQHSPAILPRTTTTVFPPRRLGDDRIQYAPLCIRKITAIF
jgi:hypothetical protein